jgi:hypothetical protein
MSGPLPVEPLTAVEDQHARPIMPSSSPVERQFTDGVERRVSEAEPHVTGQGGIEESMHGAGRATRVEEGLLATFENVLRVSRQPLRALPADPKRNGWQTVSSAPFDRALEIAVIDTDGPHALVFPCRRILNGWVNTETNRRIEVHPTHWRSWQGLED